MTKHLLDDEQLEATHVVANARMNRGRGLRGVNSYEKELRRPPLEWLRELVQQRQRRVRWLDVCCGSGYALLQAAAELRRTPAAFPVEIHGVDLVGMFEGEGGAPELKLTVASLRDFAPDQSCDLITCVHGLHYVGDKLGLIARSLSWLTEDGLLLANLDLDSFRAPDGSPLRGEVRRAFRRHGIDFDRGRLLRCQGRRHVRFSFRYVGADPHAGPNYTRQEAVDSYYEPA